MFQFYVNKTLILSGRHCWVLELNEVVISLSGKGGESGFMFAFSWKSILWKWFLFFFLHRKQYINETMKLLSR